MLNRTYFAVTTLSLLAIASIANAQGPNNGQPLTQAYELISNGGDVTAQIMPFEFGGYPGYNNLAYYVPSGSTGIAGDTFIGQNHDFNNNVPPVDLGTISGGHEVVLGLGTAYNGSSFNDFFYTGAGSRNSDGQIHAYMNQIDSSTVRVDFEDLPAGGSDWNYGDASILVHGVHAQAVPEPAPMVALGLGALGLIRRRKQK